MNHDDGCEIFRMRIFDENKAKTRLPDNTPRRKTLLKYDVDAYWRELKHV